MGNLTFDLMTSHPRTYCAMYTRGLAVQAKNDWVSAGWWSEFAALANSLTYSNMGPNASTYSTLFQKVLVKALYTFLTYDPTTTAYADAMEPLIDLGDWLRTQNYVGGKAYGGSSQSLSLRRQFCRAQAIIYDFCSAGACADKVGASWRQNIGLDVKARLLALNMYPSFSTGSQIASGYEHENAGIWILGRMALGTDYSWGFSQPFMDPFDYWWGGNSSVTIDGVAEYDAWRYYGENGGGWKDSWYWSLSTWAALEPLWLIAHGATNLQLNSQSYNPFQDETWVGKIWKWVLHHFWRPNAGFVHGEADVRRLSNPIVAEHQFYIISYLMAVSETTEARRYLRWLLDRQKEFMQAKGQWWAAFLTAALHAMVKPTTVPALDPSTDGPKMVFFQPPGVLCYTNGWGPQMAQVRINVENRFHRGHEHLQRGSLQVEVGGTNCLGISGIYDDYSTDHHCGWYWQTISASGIVLVDDPSVTQKHRHTTTYATLWPTSGWQWMPDGLGGQWAKELTGAPFQYDPQTVQRMVSDGGGEAWKCTEGTSPSVGGTVLGDSDRVTVLFSKLNKAYLREYTHAGTDLDRVPTYHAKWMIIKKWVADGSLPAVLSLHRVIARTASLQKRIVFHFYTLDAVQTLSELNAIRIIGRGYQVDPNYVYTTYVDVYNAGAWTAQSVGGGTQDPLVFGPTDHYYNGQNYTTYSWSGAPSPPGTCKAENLKDLKRIRVEILPKNPGTEHTFVFLVHVTRTPVGQPSVAPESYYWTEDGLYVGVTKDNAAYKLHKTEPLYIETTSSPDVEPPSAPTGLTASTPASQTVQLTWNPNPESDVWKYRVYYREKP